YPSTSAQALFVAWLLLSGVWQPAVSLSKAQTAAPAGRGRLDVPIFESPSDPNSFDLSPDAVQYSDALGLTGKLKRLDELRKQLEQFKGQKAPLELRQDVIELKTDLMASIQQARLEIDFVVAEIEEEETIFEESLRAYTSERDARVNKANLWAFRTNGALWAAAEALDIPTYRTAKLSIPS